MKETTTLEKTPGDRENLRKFSPQEWDCWLSSCVYTEGSIGRCLFCQIFKDCNLCMPMNCNYNFFLCCNIYRDYPGQKIDAAIARLEAAGIWEGEG